MDDQKTRLAELIAPALPLDEDAVRGLIVPCKRPEHGDLSMPCFVLAKSMKKNPAQIAGELAETLKPAFEDAGIQISAMGPFLNMKFDESQVAAGLLRAIQSAELFGGSDEGAGKTIVIDYSSPNIAKPFGIGHLRSTVIGASLKRLYEARGYEVVGVNHIGDWGTQFGMMIAAWKRWGDEVKDEDDKVQAFYDLYVRINKMAKDDAAIKEEARSWFVKLEEGDEEATTLWKFFRDTSLAEFNRIYELLGISFEAITGESFYNDKMEKTVKRLEDKGLAEQSDGALIIDLDKVQEGLGVCLLRKSDGATLYATRDLTAAWYRAETYKPEKIIYVVGFPQKQHFEQWFKVVELMGEDWAKGLTYVPFGHYQGMSTRGGTLVFLNEVISRTQETAANIAAGLRTREQIELSDEEIAEVGRQVGIGAVIFQDFNGRRIKDVKFDWDRMLNLQGDTGPYVQWTYARCCGILRKHGREISTEVDFSLLEGEQTRELMKALGRFPSQITRAIDEHEPSYIASYLIELAKAANAWIHHNDVIHSEDALRDARALVVASTRKVLGHGMSLLGMPILEKM